MGNLAVDNIRPSAGGTYRNLPRGVAAAWVSIELTAGTPTANDSENVSSLTDDATGSTTVGLTNAMSTFPFAVLGTNNQTAGGEGVLAQSIVSAASFFLKTRSVASSDTDYDVSGIAFGDLA